MLVLFIVAFIIGILSGFITFIFGIGINLISKFIILAFPYNLVLLPLVGFLTIGLRDRKFDQVANSMPRIFKATKQDSELSILIVPFQLITTWLAHLAGASVGREGVAVQLGATTANYIATKAEVVSRKDVTRIGMAAGFAGLFGTPLAATVFSFEVTRNRKPKAKYLLATLIATLTANFVSATLGLNHFHVETKFVVFDVRQIILFMFSVICFVIVGHLFAIGLKKAKVYYQQINMPEHLKIIVFSIIGALLIWLLNDGRYMSLGTNIIDDAFFSPTNIHVFDFLFKSLLTIYFVAIGFQGGEVTPLFAIGSSLGIVLSYYFALPFQIVAAIGYAFTFGGATNGYIASAILAIEVFGLAVAPYALLALVIALIIRNDKHSIYPNLDWE